MHNLLRFIVPGVLLLMLLAAGRVPAQAQAASTSGLMLAQKLDTLPDAHREVQA